MHALQLLFWTTLYGEKLKYLSLSLNEEKTNLHFKNK